MDTTTPNTSSDSAAQQQPQYFPVEFKGDGLEYTKLVLVNVALSIITLSIFSAWAKVRTRKYIYGNLYVLNSNFNYHADPIKILIGRLIFTGLILMYGLGAKVSIFFPIISGAIIFLGMPWFLVRGMSFNMYNTSYRNIRFGFKKEYAQAYKVIFLGYLVTAITLGLGAPYFYQTFCKFQIENIRFGKSYFKTRFTVGDFYGPYIRLIGCYILSVLCMMVFVGVSVFVAKANKGLGAVFMGSGFIMLYGGILFGIAIFNAGIFNILYKMSSIEEVGFRTSMNGWTLFKIYIQNILFGILTLGFGIPYGMYRLIKYKAQCTTVYADANHFDKFVSANSSDDSGYIADAGEELWDVDIGF